MSTQQQHPDQAEATQSLALLKQSEQRYRGLYDSIQDGILMTDIPGRILDCNQKFADMLGYTKQELLQLTNQQVTPEKWRRRDGGMLRHQVFVRGYSEEYEKEHTAKDGTIIPIAAKVWLIKDQQGNPSALWGIMRDITERKRAEAEMKRLNEELARNVGHLEAANKELEAFSYSVSHDLRAPLRAINGYARVVLDDYSDKLDGEGKRYLTTIATSAQKMGDLINDLLAFSRLSRQALNLIVVDMEALAREARDQQGNEISQRGAECRVEQLPPARGDAAMLRQVLVNLVSNAIKFTRPKAKAVIEVGAISESENIYYVKDNGVGFDMRYYGKLFGVFQRLHSESDFEGTGVGLAIVQRIIHRHGGRVWAESKPNEGATFYFTLAR